MSTERAESEAGERFEFGKQSLSVTLWGVFGALSFLYLNEGWGVLRNASILGDIFPSTYIVSQIGLDIGLVLQLFGLLATPLVVLADVVPADWGVGVLTAVVFAPFAFALSAAAAYTVINTENNALPAAVGTSFGLGLGGVVLALAFQQLGVLVPEGATVGFSIAVFVSVALTGIVSSLTRVTAGGETDRIDEALAVLEGRRILRQLLALWVLFGVLLLTRRLLLFLGFEMFVYIRNLEPWISEYATQFLQPDFEKFTTYSVENELTGWDGLIETITYVILNPITGFQMLFDSFGSNSTLLGKSVVTIIIGFSGTVLGFPFALLFGVLGSERVTPFPFNFIFRGTMSTIRAIPALVWIYILIALTNISQAGAVLAIAIDTVGNMGRLFTDELEEIEEGPIEAMRSTGGSRSQVVSFGMLSQVTTSFIAWALYILEINVRIAISLGIVGAGGIGQYIQGRFAVFDYGEGGAGLFMVIIIVISVELISTRIRARLRPEEHESKGLIDILSGLTDGQKWFGWGSKN